MLILNNTSADHHWERGNASCDCHVYKKKYIWSYVQSERINK